ncbi:hypothetical protein ACFVW1_13425 [Streptomyces olivochromogenes]|uniref:hypothetical protein n=1 Tax=Streptomyces olivochromogenes TaxID=1963 RepID=UPI0036DEE6AD
MSSDAWGELSASLIAVCEAFKRDEATHNGFLPGSPAAVEAVDEPFADEWATAPSRNANVAGLHLAHVAMDHVTGVAVLLQSQEPASIYGPSTLSRSLIEVAARCHYMLEPGIEPLERIRRQQSDRLVALWERKQLAESMHTEQPEQLQEAIDYLDGRMKTVMESARRHGLTPRKGDKVRPPSITGKDLKPIAATALVEALIGEGNGLGAYSYKTMSAVAHGREHGMMQYFTHRGALINRTHGDAFGTIEATPQQTALNLAGVPLAVVKMLDRFYIQFGWPVQDVGPAARRLLEEWRRIAEIPTL